MPPQSPQPPGTRPGGYTRTIVPGHPGQPLTRAAARRYRQRRSVLMVALAIFGCAVLLVCGGILLTGALHRDSDNANAAVSEPSSNATISPKAIATAAVGASLQIPDSAGGYTTVKLIKLDQSPRVPRNSATQPKRGQFVAALVEIAATVGGSDVGLRNFRFVASDGNVSLAESFVVGIDPQLDPVSHIEQGQKKTGYVIFDCYPGKIAAGKVQVSAEDGTVIGYFTF